MTRIGLAVSLLCLVLSILTFKFCRSIQGTRTTIHLHLCICLFLADLFFLAGISQTSPVVRVGVNSQRRFQRPLKSCFGPIRLNVDVSAVFPTGRLQVRRGDAPFLLLGCLCVDVLGRSAAVPHGGSGLQCHNPAPLLVCHWLWDAPRYCHHIGQR